MNLSRVEQILKVMLGRESTLPDSPLSRIEELLIDLKDAYESGGQEDAKLAARITELERLVEEIKMVDNAQNIAIDEKANTADLPSMTQEQYDALTEKTALYYFIYEDEEGDS